MKKIIPVLLLVGCGAAQKAPLEGYALVWRGATLQSDATAAAQKVIASLSPPDPFAAPAELGQVMVMRVVHDGGQWVEVENLSNEETDGHCYNSVPGLYDYDLHLFVERSRLRNVTRRPVAIENPNGTRVELVAGVAVAGGAAGSPSTIDVNGVQARIRLPEGAIGGSYPDARPFAETPPGETFLVEADGQTILPLGDPDTGIINWPYRTTVTTKPAGDKMLVTLGERCARFTALVTESAFALTVGGVGGTYGHSGTTDLAQIKEGAALTWPDGKPAGKTRTQVQITSAVQKKEGRRCLQVVVAKGQSLTLCVGEADYLPGFGEK